MKELKRVVFTGPTTLDINASSSEILITSPSRLCDLKLSMGGRGANAAYYSQLFPNSRVALVTREGLDSARVERLLGLRDAKTQVHAFRPKNSLLPKAFLLSTKAQDWVLFFEALDEEDRDGYVQFVQDKVSTLAREGVDALYCTSEIPEINGILLRKLDMAFRFYAPAHDLKFLEQSELEENISLCECLILNQLEYKQLREILEPDSLARRLELIVVTDGASAVKLILPQKGEVIRVTPPKIPATSEVGAGDAFAASFVCAYATTRNPRIAAEIGCTIASFSVEHLECQGPLPSPNDILDRHHRTYGSGRDPEILSVLS